MSLFLTVPISGQGTITDVTTARLLPSVMSEPFGFTDIFLYSHGWWTTAEAAMIDYNNFSIGVSRTVLDLGDRPGGPEAVALGIGLHWPSIVSEDARSILNVLQPLSFFNRARMADIVGSSGAAALLRTMLTAPRAEGMSKPRLHLIGHSFGCRVVCAALEALSSTSVLDGVTVNAALIEAAFDDDALEPGQDYGNVLSKLPQLRLLATRSDLDLALKDAYVLAGQFRLTGLPKPALGYNGPSARTLDAVGETKVSVGQGFSLSGKPALSGRLILADLTPLHTTDGYQADPFSGHHSDIFHDEIYQLLAAFMFPG